MTKRCVSNCLVRPESFLKLVIPALLVRRFACSIHPHTPHPVPSKICHIRLFGTRDLRHANLPHRDQSPARAATLSTRAASPPAVAHPQPRRHMTGSPAPTKPTSPPPILKPTRTLSPAGNAGAGTKGAGSSSLALQALDNLIEEFDGTEVVTPARGNEEPAPAAAARTSWSATSSANGGVAPVRTVPVPLAPSMTGTRYGAALGGGPPLVPAATGTRYGGGGGVGLGGTPKCARCAKAVYFAEQVKAVGKTWHKACLRCAQCGHTLDTGRLVDREGDPFCRPCYNKVSGRGCARG